MSGWITKPSGSQFTDVQINHFAGKIWNVPNPDPSNYEVIEKLELNNHLIVEIIYKDCSNYEGRKILLYRNTKWEQLEKQKLIDPHFLDDKKYISPFARFEPTGKGTEAAVKLAEILE